MFHDLAGLRQLAEWVLVLRLDGRLEIPEVFGGTRCLVTVPRPPSGFDGARSNAALPG